MRVASLTDSTCYHPLQLSPPPPPRAVCSVFSPRVRDVDVDVHTHASKQLSALRMAADGGCAPSSSAPTLPCSFSPKSRHYLAVCAQDGRLRIWNADSRALHREYVPSAHLSATCTCIAWGPCRATKVHGGSGRILNCALLTTLRALHPPWHHDHHGASRTLKHTT